MKKAKKVVWFGGGSNLEEIYQSVAMKFAFASFDGAGNILQTHPWIKCRDYLHDAIRTQLTGKIADIYGFMFEKGKNPDINLNKTELLVSQQNISNVEEFQTNITKALKLINFYEDLVGVENSSIRKVEADIKRKYNHVWLFDGPKFWITAPHLISMLTFLLRLGCKLPDNCTEKEPMEVLKAINDRNESDNDGKYLKSCWERLELLIKHHELLVQGGELEGFSDIYYEDTVISDFHNRSGVVSTCKCNTWSTELNKKLKGIFENAK